MVANCGPRRKKTFVNDLGFITNETIPPMKKYLKKKTIHFLWNPDYINEISYTLKTRLCNFTLKFEFLLKNLNSMKATCART